MNSILLVQQYLGKNNEVGPIFPIGLAYLATAIQHTNWEIKVLDMNVCENPYETLSKTMESYVPTVVALSIRNIDNVDYEEFNYFYLEIGKIINSIKRHKCILVVGGAGFTIFAKEIFERNHIIDYGIVQEGEETIVELLNCIENDLPVSGVQGVYYRDKEGSIHFSGLRPPIDFSKSEMPNRDFFEIEKYFHPLCVGVQTKRGCSLKCSYCTYPYLNKHTERFRLPSDVVDEIEHLKNKYGVEEIIFCDDIFNVPQKHCLSIINEIIERKIKIKWSAWFDVANTDIDLLRLAVKSGCYRFCFSIEGVTNNTLKALNKNFNTTQVNKLIRLCGLKEFGNIDFRFSFFAMPPKQSMWGMIKTITMVLKTHVIRKNSKCLVSWIRIFPNTELYTQLLNKEIELLPNEISKKSKSQLFYHPSYPKTIVNVYKKILDMITSLRIARKKIGLVLSK